MVWTTGRLNVDVIKARGLCAAASHRPHRRRAADKSGTSDPFVSVHLIRPDGTPLGGKALKTPIQKKTLAPEWDPPCRFVFDDVKAPLPLVRFEVWDWNRFGSYTLLGRADFALSRIANVGGGAAAWLTLEAVAPETHASGDVEVRLALAAGTGNERSDALAEAAATRWFVRDEDDDDAFYADRPPNVLRVAVIQARGLKAADRPLIKALGGVPSSDPYLTLRAGADGAKFKSKTIKKSLEPLWLEVATVPLKKGLDYVTVNVWDWDLADPDDFLGGLQIDIADLPELEADGSAPATWHLLLNAADLQGLANDDDEDCGEVELALKLAYDPAADPSEDRPFFDEALDAECYAGFPNEIRIAVCRAKGLRAADAAVSLPFRSLAASSDPYTRVAVGSSWQVTKTKKKTLAPVWNEALAFELFGDESEAAVSVWDWDLVGSDDLLGRVSLPLDDVLANPGKAFRAWHSLTDSNADDGDTLGEVLIVMQARFNRDSIFSPFEADHSDLAPNELRLALFRGRGLLGPSPNTGLIARIGNAVGHAGDSLRVEFSCGPGAFPRPWRSAARDRAQDATWREIYSRPLERFEGDVAPYHVVIRLREVNSVTDKDRILGQTFVSIKPHKNLEGWYDIDGSSVDGSVGPKLDGASVYLATSWWHNAENVYQPLDEEKANLNEEEQHFEEWPNELVVALHRARDLPIADRSAAGELANLMGRHNVEGSSDPYAVFSLRGTVVHTSQVRKKTLHPVWREAFAFECQASEVVTVAMYDHDQVSFDDFLCQCEIELKPLLDRRVHRRWHSLYDQTKSRVVSEVELVLQWRYRPELDAERAAKGAAREAAQAEALEAARLFKLKLRRESIDAAEAAAAARRFLASLVRQPVDEVIEATAEALQTSVAWDGRITLRGFDDVVYEAASNGQVGTLRAYLEECKKKGELRSALEERGSRRGRALLHEAAQAGQDAVVRLLVGKYGARLDVRTLFGRDTPAHLAASQERRHTLFVLLQLGASAQSHNKYRQSPLHYASKLSIVRLLLRHGANGADVDAFGKTPADRARDAGADPSTLFELHKARDAHEREALAAALGLERAKEALAQAAAQERFEAKRAAVRADFDAHVVADYSRWRGGEINGTQMLKLRTRRAGLADRFDGMVSALREPHDAATKAKLALTYGPAPLRSDFQSGMRTFAKQQLTAGIPDRRQRQSMHAKSTLEAPKRLRI